MAIKDALLPEFDHEIATTRRVLERIPDATFGWAPHPKSMTMGALAGHLAMIPHWGDVTMSTTEIDMATMPPPDVAAAPKTTAQVLDNFDRHAAACRARLAATDADYMVQWTLKYGAREMFSQPRVVAVRSFVLSHLVHHRGQMSVYLRLKDIPVPAIYGPSADEGSM
jgi:uncharacterized damage-inducible protein DinB